MRLVCQKDILLQNLNTVSKAVSQKSTLSILQCIFFTADPGIGFKMIANDLEMGIETKPITACEIEEFGNIALDARMVTEIIRKLPDGDVSIETEKNNLVTIKSGFSEFKIIGRDGEEFPFLPVVEQNDIYYTIDGNVFKNMIRQTIFSVSTEDSKPALTGELIEIMEDVFSIVAIDGFRISYRKTKLDEPVNPASVIVPGKALSEISKIIQDQDEQITIYFTDKHILFDLSECIVVSRLIEGEFMKYAQMFTGDFNTRMVVDRQQFLMCLDRATLVTKDAKKSPVLLSLGEETVKITSNGELGASYDELKADTEGEVIEISFNPRYLMDALKVIEDDLVQLLFVNALNPCIIRGTDHDNYTYLVLPLRLKS